MKEKSNFFYKNEFLLPFFSGILLGTSRLPLNFGFLAFFSFIPLFFYYEKTHSIKNTIFAATVFSSSYTLVSLHWISLVTFGGFIALFFLFGFYFSLLFLAVNYVRKIVPKLTYLAFFTFWMIFEYLQSYGELRFPWFNVGYSLAEYNLLIQIADIGGVYLVSAFTILVSFFIYKIIKKIKLYIFLFLAITVLWISYGTYKIHTIKLNKTDTIVSLVQASVPQDLKWEASFADSTLEIYKKQTANAALSNADLIVWPESALPDYLMQRRSKFRRFVDKQLLLYKTDIFTGFPRYEFAPKDYHERYMFYNSASVFKANFQVDKPYDKNILVPVGERMPFLDIFPILWKLQFGQANFNFGNAPAYFSINEFVYSPLICFEIAFPKLTVKIMEQPTDFIINITNDAWFGRSAGTYQHAVLTKFRAVEIRRTIYRAANTGYSMVVNPLGEILKKTELYERTTLTYPLIVCSEISFFTKYLEIFPLAYIFLALVIIILVIVKRIKKW